MRETDVGVWREMITGWPIAGGDWVVKHADGEVFVRNMSNWSSAFDVTGQLRYPAAASGEVEQFTDALDDEAMQAYITEARLVAQRECARRDIEGAAAFPSGYGWDGNILPLAAPSVAQVVRHRVTGKQAPRADPLLPVRAEREPALDLSAGAGYAWLLADLDFADNFGSLVDLPRGSLVKGDAGLRLMDDGRHAAVRRVAIVDVPNYIGRAKERINQLAGSEMPARGDRAGESKPPVDLRERLGLDKLPHSSVAVDGVLPDGGDAVEDVRTLWVQYDDHGARHRRWREVVKDSKTMSGFDDWPFEGESSCLELCKHYERFGGDPKLWLQMWLRERNLEARERTSVEMTFLMDTLYYAGCYDQLNMGSLACLENVGRRICQIVEAYATDSARPNWSSAKYYMGQQGAADCVPMGLRSYVARKAKDAAELEKNRSAGGFVKGEKGEKGEPKGGGKEGGGKDAAPWKKPPGGKGGGALAAPGNG